MAVRDIRPNVAWETAVAMGAGGQGAMGQAFMELDQGRPGQERVSTPRTMQRSSGGGIDARENMGAQLAVAQGLGSNLGSSIANREKMKRRDPDDEDLFDWTIGRLVWQLTQEKT